MKEWKVYYDGTLYAHIGRDHAGKEITVNKHFHWGELDCYIPAVYLCSKGLVADLCIETQAEVYSAFLKKWKLDTVEERFYSKEEREQMQQENPLEQHFRCTALIGDQRLWVRQMSSIYHIPGNAETEIHPAMEHYHLSDSKIWGIYRLHFPWNRKRYKETMSLSLQFSSSLVHVPAAVFDRSKSPITITHPVTKQAYQLEILEEIEEPVDFPKRLPSFCKKLLYRLSPDLPANRFLLQDTVPSDVLRMGSIEDDTQSDASIGIIGGADGPTAIVFGGKEAEGLHVAFSAFHYAPVDTVTWRFSFLEKQRADVTVNILS